MGNRQRGRETKHGRPNPALSIPCCNPCHHDSHTGGSHPPRAPISRRPASHRVRATLNPDHSPPVVPAVVIIVPPDGKVRLGHMDTNDVIQSVGG